MPVIREIPTDLAGPDRLDPVHPETVASRDIAAQTPFRAVITGEDGSSTLAWHMVLPPGGMLPAYALAGCDEIVVLVAGRGTAGQDHERANLWAGHCWLCPSGTVRFFRNTSPTESAVLVGFWPSAADLQLAGYEEAEPEPDLAAASVDAFSRGTLVHADEVPPETMDAGNGWSISDFRLPFGRHNGSATTLFRARFLPGAVHRKHRHDHCEEIYYVIRGHGLAGAGGRSSEVNGGHFHYIPAGTEHWLVNRDPHEPVDVVGVYIGAGSVEETGYVYTGDISPASL